MISWYDITPIIDMGDSGIKLGKTQWGLRTRLLWATYRVRWCFWWLRRWIKGVR